MRIHPIAIAALVTVVACGGTTAGTPAATQTAAATTATPTAKPLTASVELKDKDGTTVATATLTEQSSGVRIVLTATKLPAGQHGWHIHTVGKCDAPDFTTAGGHFNPDAKQHGAQNPQGAHAGDLGNLTVGADGTARTDVVAKASLAAGTSLLKTDGTAIVIHAAADDEKTDPTGNSGARIACGVVKSS